MRTDHETLSLSITDGILLVTLDRPEAMNSFTVTMADELEATFREVDDDDEVRAVVVTGSCSGPARHSTWRGCVLCHEAWRQRRGRRFPYRSKTSSSSACSTAGSATACPPSPRMWPSSCAGWGKSSGSASL